MTLDIGSCFHREHDPAQVIVQAREAERSGYREFWVIEDCFYTAGISLATAALVATDSIGVGIGIMPTVARNPAIAAMEIATIAALAPGRFHAGFGHGVQSWMAQMNEQRDSPLTMMEETLVAVRGLLRGDRISSSGRYVRLEDVALDQPPASVPPVSAGVRGPKSLQLAGRTADGTILADFVNPTYIEGAVGQIAAGSAERVTPAATTDEHRITVFAAAAIGPDGAAMRDAVAPHLASVCEDAPLSLRMAPFFPELSERAERSSWTEAIGAMPAQWWQDIAAVGTPDDAAAYLERIEAAGAHAVGLFPDFVNPTESVRQTADYLF